MILGMGEHLMRECGCLWFIATWLEIGYSLSSITFDSCFVISPGLEKIKREIHELDDTVLRLRMQGKKFE